MQTRDFVKLGNIRENENLGITESKTESLNKATKRISPIAKTKTIAKLLLIPCLFMLSACVPRISDVPQDSQVSLNLSDTKEEINTRWWEDFHNPALLYLLTNAREFHTQNKLANTQIEAAKNALKIARAALFPSLDANIAPAYNQTILHSLYGLAQGSLDVSYHLDFFGKYHYAKKSKYYVLQASIAQSHATRLSIDVLVAKTYITLLALQSRLELLYTTLEARKKEQTIIEDRKKVGYISAYDAQQAIIQYESVKTQIAETSLTIAKTKNALQYLTGIDVDSKELLNQQGFIPQYMDSKPYLNTAESHTNIHTESNKNPKMQSHINSRVDFKAKYNTDSYIDSQAGLYTERDSRSMPRLESATYAFNALQAPKLPSYISSKLLNNRPDVLYAEFMLASSSEYLKKARADFLPDFNIGLNFGAAGLRDFTQFLLIGGVSGSILAPLFKGGKLKGAFGIANAQRDEAAYIYRDVVIKAYQEAKDAHSSVMWIDSELESLKKQETAATKALEHAKERYDTGYSSYLEVIDAQRSLLEIQIGVISAQSLYLESMVNLYAALGGGIEYPKEILEERKNRGK